MPPVALLLALATAAPETVETAHYRLVSEAPAEERAEFERVLEAGWAGYRDFFGAEPPLRKGERLLVRFYETRAAWEAGIRADGAVPPAGAGGYYWTGTKTAHLYRQPTRYFTRVLLLHEAGHQFHFLARTGNREPTAGWYTEGLVEYLSWHAWDGEKLTLGVLPAVSAEDYPAKALEALRGGRFDLARTVEGEVPAERPVAWALIRFLATSGKEGKAVPRFDALRRKLDAGGAGGPLFSAQIGQPKAVQKRLAAWIESEQQPFVALFNEWEGIAAGRVRGRAGVVSACRLRGAASTLAATLEPFDGAASRAGLLLHFAGPTDFTVALLDARGTLVVDRRTPEGWTRLAERSGFELPAAGLRLEARRADGAVSLRVGDAEAGDYPLGGDALGLALDNGEATFRELSWR